MKSIWKNLASILATVSLWVASAGINVAHAVNDLPGGPAVNQLNLYPLSPLWRVTSNGCIGSC